ncbi:MAG TPA: MATE family efflux transporter [Pirellulales bacterium]|nr:MATE family efflux transporter [Pirellulales bacterium]
MPNPKRPLTEGPIWIALVRLSVPIILSNILQSAYQLTDTFWVGRLPAGAAAVAAVSLSFPINFLCISLAGGLPIAGTVLVAQYRGKQDERAVSHVAAQTLLLCLAVSLLLAVGGFALSQPLMRFMGAAPDVLPDAVRFLQVTFLGFVFVFGFFAYQALMRGVGIVYPPMFIVLLTVLLNFILDPFFIFGCGPVPAMGVSGAAMATLCTQALATAIGMALLLRKRSAVHLHWRDFRPDWRLMGTLFKIGAPSSVEQSTQALGMTLMMLLVSTFGTDPIAAYGVGTRVLSVVIIPAMGLSLATSTLVGQNIGAGRMDRAEHTNAISCLLSFSTLLAAGVFFFFTGRGLSMLLMPTGGAAIDESAQFIRIVALCFPFLGLQQVLTGTLRGAGDTIAPMLLAIISLWVLRFPLAYVLSKHTPLGSNGVWWSVSISIIVSSILAGIWFLRGDWKRKRLLDEVRLEDSAERQMAMEEGLPF